MMNIRPIEPRDITILGKVYLESFKEVDPSEEWTNSRASELIEFIYSRQRDLAFLLEEKGEIGGGILGMIKPWWDGNHLVETELFLSPRCQRQGFGRQLFCHYLEAAKQNYQVTVMESLTFKDLEFPLSWYVKMGFEPKKDWQVMFGDVETVVSRLRNKV